MTDIARAIVQTWVPKGQGKGGEFSNCTPYDSDADTFLEVRDCVIESNAWVPRPVEVNPGTLPNAQAGGTAQWNLPGVNSMEMGNFYLGGTALQSAMYASVNGSGGQALGVYLIDPFNSSSVAYKIRAASSANKWTFRLVKNRMYMANGSDRPTISSSPLYSLNNNHPYPSTLTYPWGCIAPVTAPSYSITSGSISTGSLSSVINGSTAIVGSGTSFTSAVVGQTIFILGVPYLVAAITDNTHLTLGGGPNANGNYSGQTGTVANGGWQINTGALSWAAGAGFQYAYSYFDPATGHTSNMSPILAVNDGPPNNGGVSVALSNIQQLLDVNNANPDPRFTQIIVWRTGDNGGSLFPLVVLTNDPSKGGYPNSGQTPPFTYTDNQSDSTKLGTVGSGPFPGPTSTNAPPPSDLNYIAYAQGRFWGFSPSNPGLLIFSSRVDSNNPEIPVGVAEESWPPQFTIPIPETDGVGTGIRLVGSNIYAETAKGIYAVTGNSPSNYQLVLVSSKGNGTSHFATARLPGEDANSGDILVHFGNDGRLYFLYGAGGDIGYSYPIQDQLVIPSINPSSNYSVGVMHNQQGTYLLLAYTGGITHAFDVERQVWFSWSLGFTPQNPSGVLAMCEALFGNSTVFFISNGSAIWALQADPTASQVYFSPLLLTQRFNPPGTDRFDQKLFDSLYLYDTTITPATLSSSTWQATVSRDGKTAAQLLVDLSVNTRTTLSEPSELYFPREGNNTFSIGRTFQFSWTCNPRTVWKLAQATVLWAMKDESLAPG